MISGYVHAGISYSLLHSCRRRRIFHESFARFHGRADEAALFVLNGMG